MVRALAAYIGGSAGPADHPTIDVGCGTGIFTPQLARALPAGFRIIGVEPALQMRQAAIDQSAGLAITFSDGTAEALPIGDGAARAIVTATAAHWFDRPRFYAEAARAVPSRGVLAIVEYIRHVTRSPAAAAVEDFLAREGVPKAYVRPDYAAELETLPDFDRENALTQTLMLPLDIDGFVGSPCPRLTPKPFSPGWVRRRPYPRFARSPLALRTATVRSLTATGFRPSSPPYLKATEAAARFARRSSAVAIGE